jgi:hypothetical protein
MFEIYDRKPLYMYTRADRDPASKLIRACRWVLWAAMLVSIALVLTHGTSRRQNPFALIEWVFYFAFSTGNFALFVVERRRKEDKEFETL